MLRVIRQNELIEGRWRNGMGTSWEIASYKIVGAEDFSWRFAKARIDGDVPFSMYPGMDRIFMMLDGDGMDLEFANGEVLQVHERFVPHKFVCDVPLNCKLLGRPSMDLNLFAARGEFSLACEVLNLSGMQTIKLGSATTVIYALAGEVFVSDEKLNQDDSAVVTDEIEIICNGQNATLYIGRLNLL